MKDQHKHIKGYRDLSRDEVKLMNQIKDHAEKTRELIDELEHLRKIQEGKMGNHLTDEQELESRRCSGIAREKLQTGYMWLTRATALPTTF